MTPKVVAIIPARGGSKGIPRKNLRPLAGFPLIYYSIRAAINAKTISRVVVSTDDEEIALFAERFGAAVVMRDASLADDRTTLDPVIMDAMNRIEEELSEIYDFVVTIQPTSPLVRSSDIDVVVTKLLERRVDTVLTVVDDRHLCWTVEDGVARPKYRERLNRQSLPLNYRETGAVVACRKNQLLSGSRFGNSVEIHEVPHEYSFDIDTFADLYVCEALLSRKKIVFTVVGYAEVGLGHAYRAIMFAHELVQYELMFICEEKSDLAIDFIRSNNYEVIVVENGTLARVAVLQKPDLVINDILDTSAEYMTQIKDAGIKTINFEDLGDGSKLANLVVNALYPSNVAGENVLVGPKYFCLRDEFIYLDKSKIKQKSNSIRTILITFGGVDEGNLTAKALQEIAPVCANFDIRIEIVTGPGYAFKEKLALLVDEIREVECVVVHQTKRISDYMSNADFAITSAGRTVLELASLSVPMIVICQNHRETTHTFASEENGIINLGYRGELRSGRISQELKRILQDANSLQAMKDKMKSLDLKGGKARVVELIKSYLN